MPDASATTPRPPGIVLVVDDDGPTRTLLARWLVGAGLEVVEASDGPQSLSIALANAARIDAVVLDVMMPAMDGYEVLRRLRSDPATSAIPVVLVTAHGSEEEQVLRSLEGGAIDHIGKPFRGSVLAAKVKAFAERRRVERSLESRLASAEALATIDGLTALFNRRHFDAQLAAECAHAVRHRTPLAVLLVDLDYFKTINDLFGHAGGDRVLVRFAREIRAVLRPDDLAFRIGGEEFAILLRSCDARGAEGAAERLRARLEQDPIALGTEERVISFSGGVAAADATNGFRTADLVARADEALYRAKRLGRDRIEIADAVRASENP
jgi:diguanylate cyclase (GGDEF)-like protein